VMHEARSFSWTAGKAKVLAMIGDDVPHTAHDRQNTKKLRLAERAVDALGARRSRSTVCSA
jgi:hypothetical protein